MDNIRGGSFLHHFDFLDRILKITVDRDEFDGAEGGRSDMNGLVNKSIGTLQK